MNREKLFFLKGLRNGLTAGAVTLGVLVGGCVEGEDHYPDSQPVKVTPGSLPEHEGLVEQAEPKTIESVVAYLKNLPNPQILPIAEEMERWSLEERIYRVGELAPEQSNLRVERGRFVGTWVTWGERDWNGQGLRIQVLEDYLRFQSVRDLAINLYVNALFAKNSSALIAGDSVEELLNWANQKARADFQIAFQATSLTD